MTTYQASAQEDPQIWANTEKIRPRVLRGLRFPVLPSGAWLAQTIGGAATLLGVYLQFGVAITLIAGGVAFTVLGALREAGKV